MAIITQIECLKGQILGSGDGGTYHYERGVDVSARVLGVAVIVRGLVRLVLALLAHVQLVPELHSVEVICAREIGDKPPFKMPPLCLVATWNRKAIEKRQLA